MTHSQKRRRTREVFVGHLGFGGSYPIRIQSMTTSSTRNVEATFAQILRLVEAGCEMVRMTVQGMKEVEACEQIKNKLVQQGCLIPLVADIHFYPPAAMGVIDFVDKVRINPGNYADKRASFQHIDYDDKTYAREIEKLEEKFIPLVDKCKRLKKAMRIGVNHGSLSDRIMNRYGDTPQGMIESAIEFANICRQRDFHDIFFSMKSSNPLVMIQAYRLLCEKMRELDWDYPMHLGVTEAGEGEDGRIKSAIGIGTLLCEGIGDTLRVSLTEDPWNEIGPCRKLIALAGKSERAVLPITRTQSTAKSQNHHKTLVIIGPIKNGDEIFIGSQTIPQPDGVFSEHYSTILEKECRRKGIDYYFKKSEERDSLYKGIPVLSLDETEKQFDSPYALQLCEEQEVDGHSFETKPPSLIFLSPSKNRVHTCRKIFERLQEKQCNIPIILHFCYDEIGEDLVIAAACEMGALLCDGIGDGIWIEAKREDISFVNHLSFSILQGARLRSFKTEFISCPSCGRTLFDIQDVSKKIRQRMSHLPGVKIAIMGCIVNGPGEMADADFGYVGSKEGKVDLYVGKECVEKNICSEEAVDRLIDLIKKHGRWRYPEEEL